MKEDEGYPIESHYSDDVHKEIFKTVLEQIDKMSPEELVEELIELGAELEDIKWKLWELKVTN